MLTRVWSVGIYGSDQQRALEFYTRILGCELVTDQPMGPEPDAPRWFGLGLESACAEDVAVTPPETGQVLLEK